MHNSLVFMFHLVNVCRCGYAIHIEGFKRDKMFVGVIHLRITLLLFLTVSTKIIESQLYEVFLSIYTLNTMVPHYTCLLQMMIVFSVFSMCSFYYL